MPSDKRVQVSVSTSDGQTIIQKVDGSTIIVKVRNDAQPVTNSPSPSRARRGVNIAGAEFGAEKAGFSNSNPGAVGTDYTYNSERTVEYYAALGARLLRLPFRWERVQPQLGGALREDELASIRTFVAWAENHGCKVILDVHNYGRYVTAIKGQRAECVIDSPNDIDAEVTVRGEHFVDLWSRLSFVFRDNTAVDGYGLMNEPHDMGHANWRNISQRAVDAIRKNGDQHAILVAGLDWSHSCTWDVANGNSAWIRDPLGKSVYEAHIYFDADDSGQYSSSFDDESKNPDIAHRGECRLIPFVRWLRANNVPGFIGEMGIPKDDVRWLTIMSRFLAESDTATLSTCLWAGGEWWGDYRLSVQPPKGDWKTVSATLLSYLR